MKELPMYLRPNQIESHIGISAKTLRDLKDSIFKKGTHYFIPKGLHHPLWNRDALLSWINSNDNDEISSIVNDILNN